MRHTFALLAVPLLAAGGDLLLKDVARECGFSSAKHMAAVFRRLEGLNLRTRWKRS